MSLNKHVLSILKKSFFSLKNFISPSALFLNSVTQKLFQFNVLAEYLYYEICKKAVIYDF